jgi:hypothetical protein
MAPSFLVSGIALSYRWASGIRHQSGGQRRCVQLRVDNIIVAAGNWYYILHTHTMILLLFIISRWYSCCRTIVCGLWKTLVVCSSLLYVW